MALHLKLSQPSSTLVFLCPPVCHGHLTYREFVARLAKSLAFCTDDTTNILTLPTLLHLYLSLVRPQTEYVAQVWDPHLYEDISSLDNIQKFALRVCCKNWNMGYSELLDLCKVPSLENRHLYLKLSHMFKIVNNLCYFPPEIMLQRPTVLYFPRPSLLQQPLQNLSICPDAIRNGIASL